MAGYGAYKTFSAEGGEIKAYNNGGLVALAEGGGAEQQMGLGAIAPQPMDAPQDVAAPSVEGLGKQARDLVVSTRGDINQINGIPGVPDIVRTMAASMVAKQMSAPQPPDSTVAQKLLNPQPQMPSAGLASAPLPDNAFTAAEGGIVGYASAGEVPRALKFTKTTTEERRKILENRARQAQAEGDVATFERVIKQLQELNEPVAERSAFMQDITGFGKGLQEAVTPSDLNKGFIARTMDYFSGKTPKEIAATEEKYFSKLYPVNPEEVPVREGVKVSPAPTPTTGLPAIKPTSAPAPQVQPAQPAKEEPPVDYMAKAKELFAGVPSASMSPEELATMKKQQGYEALMQFGASLAGSKSPTFLGGLGEAAGATAPAIAEISKAQRAEQAARKKEDREMAILQIQTALGLDRDAAEKMYKQQTLELAEKELSVKEQEIEANREIKLENLMLRAEAAVKASGDAQLDRRLQVLRTILPTLPPEDPKYTALVNELMALGGSGGSGLHPADINELLAAYSPKK
jgi:hypothetical protein